MDEFDDGSAMLSRFGTQAELLSKKIESCAPYIILCFIKAATGNVVEVCIS